MRSPRLEFWNPFSAESIGLIDDEALLRVHNRPYLGAIERLASLDGWRCTNEYFTMSLRFRRVDLHGVTWRFWPEISPRLKRTTQWRAQFSVPALMYMFANPADVTIVHTSGLGSRFSQLMGSVCRARRKPYLAHIASKHISFSPNMLEYYRGAACIITETELQRKELEANPLLAGVPIRVFLIGVDADRFAYVPRRANIASAPRLLFVGRVIPSKGTHIAVEALAKVRTKFPDATLDIVGPSTQEKYDTQIRTLIAQNGLENHVRWRGLLSHDRINELYRDSDVLLLPSSNEGCGFVILEAMSCGMPVVALAGAGGPDELIKNGIDGLLTTAQEFPGAVLSLVSDANKLQSLGDSAARRIRQQFTYDHSYRALREIVLEARERDSAGRNQQ